MDANVFKKTGCTEDCDYKGVYYHPKLPFSMHDINGYLSLSVNLEYTISSGTIPTDELSIIKLIEAFNP